MKKELAMLVAGDIGGTKTDLAIYSIESGPHAPLTQAQFHSANYDSLQAMVSEFLAQVKVSVEYASFDVAGPVIDGHVKTTNLPWVMDEISLAKDLHLKSVLLINDLEAVARAVPVLRAIDLVTLNEGQPVSKGTIAVIAPGTGLGESFLTWDGSQYQAHGSEGGHSDFAPTDERQIHLLEYLLQRFDHVAVERVCSGIGVPNVYEYLRDTEHIPERPEVAQLIASAKDYTKAIVEAASDPNNPSELCRATIKMFVSIHASVRKEGPLQGPNGTHSSSRDYRLRCVGRSRKLRAGDLQAQIWGGGMNKTLPVTYLARHGETAWTITGQHTGRT